MELLGEMPRALALSGKYSHEMFNRRGESICQASFPLFTLQPYHDLSMLHSPCNPATIPALHERERTGEFECHADITGELRHINRLRLWPLMSVLKEKYLMEPAEAELLSSFLLPMLHYYPDSRASAAEMVKHPWLEGVIVQGELEMANSHGSRGNATAAAGGAGGAGVALDEVIKLGPSVKGMVGMGRI